MKLVKYVHQIHVRPLHASMNSNYHATEFQAPETLTNTHFRALGTQSLVYAQRGKTNPTTPFSPALSNLRFRSNSPLIFLSSLSSYQSCSLSFSSKPDKPGEPGVPAASGASEADVSNSGLDGSEIIDKVKEAWQRTIDVATYTGQKAKEVSDELTPHVDQLLDSHPYLKNVVIPVGGTLAGTILAWVVMPRFLRRFHKYATQGPAALPFGSLSEEQVPYEKSIWGALEDPLRYLITFMAFSQMLVVPKHPLDHILIFILDNVLLCLAQS